MTQVFLIVGSSSPWSVPADFTVAGHTVEMLGAGGNGAIGSNPGTSSRGGGGGGGGAYRKLTYSSGTITPGTTTIAFRVGVGGEGTAAGSGSLWENTVNTNVYTAGNGANAVTTTLGGGGTNTTTGSPAIVYTATTSQAGGNGGGAATGAVGGGGGGGGSGGPASFGGAGFTANTTAGGGGGGANNGTTGNSTGQTGGTGSSGTGGGASVDGTGNSGGGGSNTVSTAILTLGGTGGAGTDFDGAHGSGGGGGGSGSNSGNVVAACRGAPGGSFGGGGAGGGSIRGTVGTSGGGVGANGLIVITYTSTQAPFIRSGAEFPSVDPVIFGYARSDQAIWAFTIPFSQTSWPRGSPVRLSPALNIPYNQNLYTAVAPVQPPFSQDDWPRVFSRTYNIAQSSGALIDTSVPPPQAPFSQDDWPQVRPVRYSTALSDQGIWALTIPFNQTYWPSVFSVPNFLPPHPPYNPNIYVAPVQPPFSQDDWSKPQKPAWSKEPPNWSLNINLFKNPVPFGPFDWSKPFEPIIATPQHPLQLSLTLFANLGPFTQVDFSKAQSVDLGPQWQAPYNLNIYAAVQAPLTPVNWPRSFFPTRPHDPARQPLNINLFTNPIPFAQYDWSKPNDVVLSPPIPQPYNINLYGMVTVTVPFNCWPAAYQPQATPLWQQPYNLSLYTAVVQAPFAQLDWSKPYFPDPVPTPSIPYNLNLYTLGPVSLPFNQDNWPPTNRIAGIPGLSDQAIWEFISPFSQTDWSKPFRLRASVPHPITINLALTAPVVQNPFRQLDWPTPFIPRLNLGQNYGAIVDITQPFAQYDWSKPQAVRLAKESPNWGLNVNLFVAPAGVPFRPYDYSKVFESVVAPQYPAQMALSLYANLGPFTQVDFSKAQPVRASVPQGQVYNPNIYTIAITAPLVPVDWSKPYFPLPAREPVRQSLNINLFTNPVPFAQYDWSKTVSIKGAPATAQPYNLNLYGVVTVAIPFAQYDWSKSVAAQAAPVTQQPYNLNLYGAVTITVPFNNWPATYQPSAAPPQPQSYNLNLYTVPAGIPFKQTDWLKVSAIRASLVAPQPLNLNLFGAVVVSAPFRQVDWAAARISPRQTAAAPQPLNLNLFAIQPKPFNQTSWAAAYRVRAAVPRFVTLSDNLALGLGAGRVKVWTGTAWILKPTKVWTGSSWQQKPVKVWNGSAWV